MPTHVTFERQPDGSIKRIEVLDDRAGRATPYDRALNAVRPPASPEPVKTKADLDALAKAQQGKPCSVAQSARPQPAEEFVHLSTERRGNKLVTRRTRRDGTYVEHETTPPPAPVPVENPLPYEERLKRARL